MTKCSIIIGIFLIAAINGQASKRRIQYESVSQFLFHNSKLCKLENQFKFKFNLYYVITQKNNLIVYFRNVVNDF